MGGGSKLVSVAAFDLLLTLGQVSLTHTSLRRINTSLWLGTLFQYTVGVDYLGIIAENRHQYLNIVMLNPLSDLNGRL
jgi:hypothetical protein